MIFMHRQFLPMLYPMYIMVIEAIGSPPKGVYILLNNINKWDRSTNRNYHFSCGFACGKYSTGIPKDFAANNATYTKFPVNPDAAGNVYFADDFPAKILANIISRFP